MRRPSGVCFGLAPEWAASRSEGSEPEHRRRLDSYGWRWTEWAGSPVYATRRRRRAVRSAIHRSTAYSWYESMMTSHISAFGEAGEGEIVLGHKQSSWHKGQRINIAPDPTLRFRMQSLLQCPRLRPLSTRRPPSLCGHSQCSAHRRAPAPRCAAPPHPKHDVSLNNILALHAQGKDLEQELTCHICYQLFHHPCTLVSCQHSFCAKCLQRSLDHKSVLSHLQDSRALPLLPVHPCQQNSPRHPSPCLYPKLYHARAIRNGPGRTPR
jgi:hypothetical protein